MAMALIGVALTVGFTIWAVLKKIVRVGIPAAIQMAITAFSGTYKDFRSVCKHIYS